MNKRGKRLELNGWTTFGALIVLYIISGPFRGFVDGMMGANAVSISYSENTSLMYEPELEPAPIEDNSTLTRDIALIVGALFLAGGYLFFYFWLKEKKQQKKSYLKKKNKEKADRTSKEVIVVEEK